MRRGAGGAHVDPASVEACRQQLGLNDPLIVQFLHFLWSYCTFDFGISMWSGHPVSHEIAVRLPVSLEVAVMATIIDILIAIPLGTISARRTLAGPYGACWRSRESPRRPSGLASCR
jgi:peptide/nickel transport system permease protein